MKRPIPTDSEETRSQPATLTVESHYGGTVCPDCQRETGWDYFHWMIFMAGLTDEETS